MKNLIISIVIALILPQIFKADEVIYGVEKQDADFTNYYFVKNVLQDITYDYTIGEVLKKSHDTTIRIYLRPQQDIPLMDVLRGIPDQGVDTLIRDIAHTSKFTYQSGDTIEFFRLLNGTILCDTEEDDFNEDFDPWGVGDIFIDHWKLGNPLLEDQAEFVFEIVNPDDLTILCAVDSVGVTNNPHDSTSWYVHRYGTNPDQVKHQFVLPPGPDDSEVFLRIKPKRWGTTFYGMRLGGMFKPYTLSSIIEKQPYSSNIYKCSQEVQDSLLNIFVVKFFDFCDSLKINTGIIPIELNNSANLRLPHSIYNDIFLPRYYEQKVDSIHGGYFWVQNYRYSVVPNNKAALYNQIESAFGKNELKNTVIIEKVYPLPLNLDRNYNISISSKDEFQNSSFEIYNVKGHKIGIIWTGNLNIGENIISGKIDIEIARGTYFLRLIDGSGNELDTYKIVY